MHKRAEESIHDSLESPSSAGRRTQLAVEHNIGSQNLINTGTVENIAEIFQEFVRENAKGQK